MVVIQSAVGIRLSQGIKIRTMGEITFRVYLQPISLFYPEIHLAEILHYAADGRGHTIISLMAQTINFFHIALLKILGLPTMHFTTLAVPLGHGWSAVEKQQPVVGNKR